MYCISCKYEEIVFPVFCQLPALTELHFNILEAWDPLLGSLLFPLIFIVRVKFLILVRFFNWGYLSHPGGALQTSMTLHNPVCMNDEAEHGIQVYFCLKCLLPVNIHKKKLV